MVNYSIMTYITDADDHYTCTLNDDEGHKNDWWIKYKQKKISTNNTASQGSGGAIILYEASNANLMKIIQCQFTNNTASISGGAIFKTGQNKELIIDQSIYERNTANAFGGAIYVSGTNSSGKVTDSTFITNIAIAEGGGAIYSLEWMIC